jgi:hypothetical protein
MWRVDHLPSYRDKPLEVARSTFPLELYSLIRSIIWVVGILSGAGIKRVIVYGTGVIVGSAPVTGRTKTADTTIAVKRM